MKRLVYAQNGRNFLPRRSVGVTAGGGFIGALPTSEYNCVSLVEIVTIVLRGDRGKTFQDGWLGKRNWFIGIQLDVALCGSVG